MNGEREAAERQCELGGETCGAMEPHKPEIMAGAALCGGCGRRRAAAKYTLVPADDATKLDEAWLRSVGVGKHASVYFTLNDDTDLVKWAGGWNFRLHNGANIKTRGQLRRLCTALGIPLPLTAHDQAKRHQHRDHDAAR